MSTVTARDDANKEWKLNRESIFNEVNLLCFLRLDSKSFLMICKLKILARRASDETHLIVVAFLLRKSLECELNELSWDDK